MTKTKIVLSFDDGRKDNLRMVEEILNPLNMKATINITTAYVDGTISAEHAPCENAAMSVEEVIALSKNPSIELAGHGCEHQNTIEDLGKGLSILRSWIPNRLVNGIASPNSLLSEDAVLSDRSAYEALDLSYVRIGPGKSYHRFRRICGKLARMTHSAFLYKYSIQGAQIQGTPGYVVLSVPVMKQHTLAQVKSLVSDARRQGNDLILMFHSILKPGEPYYEDTWSWGYEDFRGLCQWLQQEDYAVVTTQELISKQ